MKPHAQERGRVGPPVGGPGEQWGRWDHAQRSLRRGRTPPAVGLCIYLYICVYIYLDLYNIYKYRKRETAQERNTAYLNISIEILPTKYPY